MTSRQKTSVTLGISGGLSLIAALVLGFTNVEIPVLNTILLAVALVLESLGITVALPNTED